MIKNKTGVIGELHTARYLRDNGYEIISSDFNCRVGEIDIVAFKDDILSFVEVKTRNKDAVASPAEFVDAEKQRKIILASKIYLGILKTECRCRFDVSEVTVNSSDEVTDINYIENAFFEN